MTTSQENNSKTISDYNHLKRLSLRKISFKSELSSRRLDYKILPTNDSNQIVLINFTVDKDQIYPDYGHPVIGSVRQIAAFLKSPTPITINSPIELIKRADNCRKDIRTIAIKNKKWIDLCQDPFNSLSDFECQAWLVLYKEDYEKIKSNNVINQI